MSLVQFVPAFLLWLVVLVRFYGLRFGWRIGILPAVTLVALGATLNIDLVYLTVDRILGSQNYLNLVVHLLMGAGVTELSRLLLEATRRSNNQVKFLLIVGILLVIVQTSLMLTADTAGSATHFTDTFGDQKLVALYQATFFGWIGLVFGCTGFECLRRDRLGETRSFRVGFDFVGAGCVVGVLAVLLKLSLAVLELLSFYVSSDSATYLIYRLLIATTMVLFCIGFILPSSDRIKAMAVARREITKDLQILRPIVGRLSRSAAGARSMHAAKISLKTKTSKTQLLTWLIFIGDVRVLAPDLLSDDEIRTVVEIGAKIGNR